ncbi:MAG TPA: ATP-dependent DNA helicase [Candidatus Methylacidiphilales bacterium]|nr:ATP-dependent DNA helicase [Candidatus Methylacidiphilales bacterium]
MLLEKLTNDQADAVRSGKRRVLVVAGAGSGKTEVMARRIAWWVGIEGVPKDKVVAFTFTERAAEEMKFRIRSWIGKITPPGEEVSLGGMHIGTIHGYCLAKLREFWPDQYHNYDILDEGARAALILKSYNNLLGLKALQGALKEGFFATTDKFIQAYDQLQEHHRFEVELPKEVAPVELGPAEEEWCKKAKLLTQVGASDEAKAFGMAAARYYTYLHCRRFLDFSTSQAEFIRCLEKDLAQQKSIQEADIHLVVDEVQDINPVQMQLIRLLTGQSGQLTAVGDHRQAIYGFRGAKVDLVAELWEEFKNDPNAEVVDLKENFRSTGRIIEVANLWAETIGPVRSMRTPPMKHGSTGRTDHHPSHVALIGFGDRSQEARWIGQAIRELVPTEAQGALHDRRDGKYRGLALSDVAVLVRSSTDVRTYMRALEEAGIPSVVRAGPDLFSQPEVLLFVGALGLTADIDEFIGSPFGNKSLPQRIGNVLQCPPKPEDVLRAAARTLRTSQLPVSRDAEDRLFLAATMIRDRIAGQAFGAGQTRPLRSKALRDFLERRQTLRRLFPQQLFHWLMAEAEVENWDTCEGRGQAAMFHLGALSQLITGIETPGWTSVSSYKWQMIGLCQFGAEDGRTKEQPLMVQPEAVTISTIHAVKGLEFAAVFLADVNSSRFPSSMASRQADLPIGPELAHEIDVAGLSDNENHDGERRLMYVALTRAERFLFVSHSGSKISRFIQGVKKTKKTPAISGLQQIIHQSGGRVTTDPAALLSELRYAPKDHDKNLHLATSFSDLRYFLACPHDFYLRKVMGFAPTIDQAFGYGRGVHNLMRAIHSDPVRWAAMANDEKLLKAELQKLVDRGLFYLRYTTGDPAKNMWAKGIRIAAEYIKRFAADELSRLTFEPEKEFETLIPYPDKDGGALVSGAIDIVRRDNPPRVTLIDFKSGDPDSDKHMKLDEKEMKLQVAIYALAAQKELEYEPELGVVRYLDAKEEDKREIRVPLNRETLTAAQDEVARTAAEIRDRKFDAGPRKQEGDKPRCPTCDFVGICGQKEAKAVKKNGI